MRLEGWRHTRLRPILRDAGPLGPLLRMRPKELHHHLAFFGDGVVDAFAAVAEDHLVVGAPGRDHREAVPRSDRHGNRTAPAVDLDHLLDGAVKGRPAVRSEYRPRDRPRQA